MARRIFSEILDELNEQLPGPSVHHEPQEDDPIRAREQGENARGQRPGGERHGGELQEGEGGHGDQEAGAGEVQEEGDINYVSNAC